MQRLMLVECKVKCERLETVRITFSELSRVHIGLFFPTGCLNQCAHFPVVFILIHKNLMKYGLYRY